MALILVVDDAVGLAEQYAYDLKRIGGFETLVVNSGEKAIETLASETVDCMLLDLEMPGIDGFDVLRELDKEKVHIPVIVYTGTGNYDRCVEAIRLGARSFIDKSESMEKVVNEVRNAISHARLVQENKSLRQVVASESELVGSSPAMQRLQDQIRRLAPIPSPVLITGESGTGKELVARELHNVRFGDVSKPFIAVNCAALPDQLVESELFGHERGAFTGANRTHKGAFQQANGGTLFLDEIGEMPQATQAKLLRVLENGEIVRIGAERTIKVNARVICATNRDLDAESNAGTFREDLFFRLSVHTIHVPPLRDRQSDIPALVHHFVSLICAKFGLHPRKTSPDAVAALASHAWERNNIRELRNVIERMIIASDREILDVGDIPLDIQESAADPVSGGSGSFNERKLEAERRIILFALERNEWHITNTAAELGLADHASLLKIMRRHNVKRPTEG